MAEAAILERLLREGRGTEALTLCRNLAAGRDPAARLHLYGQVVLPAIRRLEGAWKEDLIGFSELSMAFFHAHRLLAVLAAEPPVQPAAPDAGGVLVATVPGEDHVFGAQIVADVLGAAGHEVALLLQTTAATLTVQVARQRPAVVCLSVGHDQALMGLADLIVDLRLSAPAPGPRVLIGGPALVEPFAQYHFLRADSVASNAGEALELIAATRSRAERRDRR